MAVLPIVTYPAKVLSKPARALKPGDIDTHAFFEKMVEAMETYVGVGLAAPQVGEGIRFIVAEDTRSGIKSAYINPRITASSAEKEIGPEGCLSFPGVWGRVVRSVKIRIKYQDLDFVEHEDEYEGFYARVLQHEVDHLNGVLLNMRAEDGLHEVREDEDGEEYIDDDGEEIEDGYEPIEGEDSEGGGD